MKNRPTPASSVSSTPPISERPLPTPSLESILRSWKTPSHTSTPGRNSTPNSTISSVSLASRCLRTRVADRQCSTMVCGSVPKDWMSAARPPPSIRTCTAREKASPRLGANSDSLGFLMADLPESESALEMSASGLSR